MTRIELLTPAKDLECGVAAINCGADAVYIGASRFGARENAGNDLTEIAALITHAHKYWAKVYATVNTLLHDEEIPEALRLISQLYDLGIDGLIIQDVGLLECDLPPIPLIASTQMHNVPNLTPSPYEGEGWGEGGTPQQQPHLPHSADKILFLQNVGFQRVILARELDIDQIRTIRAQTNIELEYFVHGALCVCYSGQCYLSYALGGRSGNRGQCAQPCRKPYSLIDENGRTVVDNKHLLSIHDLNLSEHLRELIDAGVCSFKIEGRLKDKAYVTNIVSYYRAKLDQVLEETGLSRSSSGRSIIDFAPDPNKTFNRGYTTYFLQGRDGRIGSIETPKMIGEPIGKVTLFRSLFRDLSERSERKSRNMQHGRVLPDLSEHSTLFRDLSERSTLFRDLSERSERKSRNVHNTPRPALTIKTNIPLHNGDGICFFDRSGELRGTVINGVDGATIFHDKMDGIDKGTLIYRNHDHEFLTRLEKSRPERRISLSLTLGETAEGLSLTAIDEDGVKAEYIQKIEKVPAEKPDLALQNIKKQLSKMGDSDYSCSEVAVELSQVYFLPISTLNALRRGALEQLAEARLQNRPTRTGGVIKNDAPYPTKELTYLANVLNKKAEAFYRRHGVTSIEPAAESGLDMRGRKLMTTRYCLKHELGMCSSDSSSDPLFLVDDEGHRLELRFDCGRCEMGVYHETAGLSLKRPRRDE